ncbi:hypothetical protein EPR50_G00018140 [Perca flavescens]|uniref:S-methyl-5'-thioadenosine phosphorylase n=1 Tax=Perca flavescens TaxID=8167 RepID=A0A484DLX1_PERFV|nr:hypothetical protein EPR50_G00018140 [Perca flavescens]
MSAIKIALQQSQKKGRRKTSEAMSAEVSPDSKCPICLDIFNNISYLNVCLHKFCFRCIQEWSKNKAECPLCKQPFNSIYHSIKSDQDFKKYDLQPVDNGSFGTFGGVRFRYRTTLTGVHRQMRGRTSPPPDNGVMFEASANPPQQPQDRYIRRMMKRLAAKRRAASEGRAVNSVREQEMVNFRRELYRRGVRIRSVRDGGRSRDTSAEFFRRNPACLHRLIPWLKRELIVLYGAHGSLVNIVQHIIMSRITRYDMEDGAIQEELRPFLQGRTEHFLHEFISFAKSPFNMEAYDQHAAYDCPAPSSNEDSSSNSSVIAISEDEEDSVELDPPGDSASTLSHSAWDDETPGPSYSTTAEQSGAECLSVLDLDSDSDSSLEEETQEFGASPQQMTPHNQTDVAHGGVNDEECLSHDSDDCVIISFVKPTAERTPELVQLSSDSDESASEDIKAVPLLPQHIRFSSLSPIASQSSDPSGAGQSENAETDHYHQFYSKDRCSSSTSSRHKTSGKKTIVMASTVPIKIGIIGGSGLDDPDILEGRTERYVDTPYGKPSDALILGKIKNVECVLLARHGRQHTIMPSNVNYQANIWALREEGCTHLLVTTACGSLREEIQPGDIVIIDQFIDRTTKRAQTLYDGQPTSPPGVSHIPMAEPFCNRTREVLVEVARSLGVKCHVRGTMLSIEGPRFSSRAESLMFRQWGADVINMTTVPEVVLAKEAGLCYASIAMATDYDCWKEHEEAVCVDNVLKTMKENANKASSILLTAIPQISQMDWAQTMKALKSMAQSSVMLPKH